MPRVSDARMRANARYNLKAYEQIAVRSRRADRLNDLIDLAADRRGISKASYIIGAIRTQLEADAVTLSDLPPAPTEEPPARQEDDE